MSDPVGDTLGAIAIFFFAPAAILGAAVGDLQFSTLAMATAAFLVALSNTKPARE